MLNTPQQQLNSIISHVNEIDKIVRKIYKSNKSDIEGNELLLNSFDRFFKELDITKKNLANPMLSISMVGTTTAGKSTIVNALSGRNVAPIERKEMSAGVLRLRHSEENSMVVSKTERAKWQAGTFTGVSDEEIRRVIVSIYDQYRAFQKTAAAPEITVYGPLQWQINKSMLDLPKEMCVEFLDLPGLKSLTDKKNLSVILANLKKSFCIVAMDFNDVDNFKIGRLLDELDKISQAMSGKIDSMVFLLNKVDTVNDTDVPVDIVINGGEYEGRRIKGLKTMVAEHLSLADEEKIKIIPFVGILLYYIEMALQKDNEGKIVNYNSLMLKSLLKDCAKSLDDNLFTDEEYEAVEEIRKSLRLEKTIPVETLEVFQKLCFRLSHSTELYEELRNRLKHSFSEVVINPLVVDLSAECQKLMGDLEAYVKINKKSSKLELISEQYGVLKMKKLLLGTSKQENKDAINNSLADISESLMALEADIDQETEPVFNRIKRDVNNLMEEVDGAPFPGYIDSQITNIGESITEISEQLMQIPIQDVNDYLGKMSKENHAAIAFKGISDVPQSIQMKLIADVLVDFRSSIDSKKTKNEYIEIASEKLPKITVDELSGQYGNLFNLFYETFSSFDNTELFWKKKSLEEYDESWEKNVRNVYDCADMRMRDVLSKRSNFYLQLATDKFISALNGFLEGELNEVLTELKKHWQVGETDLSLLINNLMNVKKHEPVLPDDLFTFSAVNAGKPDVISESRNVVDYYKKRSCKSDKAVYKTVTDKYYLYSYENAKSLYMRWEEGIKKSFAPFWSIITDWVKDSVQSYMDNIRVSTQEVSNMTMSFLDKRINDIATQNMEAEAAFDEIENNINHIKNIKLL